MKFESVEDYKNSDIISFELDEYYLFIFKVDGIPCSAMVDKESKKVIDIFTLVNGNYNGSHPYDKNTSLKNINWMPITYFEVEKVMLEYVKTYF